MEIAVVNPSLQLDAASEMQFLELTPFGAGGSGAFWANPGDSSPWEMHPDCDELLHIIEGRIELEVLPQDTGTSTKVTVPSGSYVVVPAGCWHRQTLLEKTREFYVTPGRTLHSMAADPRIDQKGA